MARRNKRNEEVEASDAEQSLEQASDQTFAESSGLPANEHAKKLAKEKSKRPPTPKGVFYTQKEKEKVVKLIVKKDKVFSVYVGSMKKHKDALAGMVKKWKEEGVWLEPHQVEAKLSEAMGKAPKAEPKQESEGVSE